jgi:uncharacterized protein
MKKAVVVLLAVALAVGGLALAMFGRSSGLKRFGYLGQPLDDAGHRALAKNGWEALTLEVEPGVTLRGLVRAPRTEGAPWVVFFPGNGPKVLPEAQAFLDRLAGDADVGLVVFAYRGFDGSTGPSHGPSIFADANKIAAAAKGPVHLLGFSLGTSMVASVAAQTKPQKLAMVAPMTEIEVGATGLLGRLKGGDRYETLKFASAVTSPALVVGALRDDAFPVEMARAVKERFKAEYVELDTTHLGLLEDERTFEALRTFFGF